jgi:hypothetical protein
MSYLNCISNGVKEGIIKDDIAKEQKELFENLQRNYIGQGLNPTEASRAAGKDAYDKLIQNNIIKKANALKQAQAQFQIKFILETHKDIKGNKNIVEAAKSLFDQQASNSILSITNLKRLEQGIAHEPIAEFMEQFRSGFFGRRTKFAKMTFPLVVKEIFQPGSTANPLAKKYAIALQEAFNITRIRQNQYGGNIKKIQGGYLPQPHDQVKVSKATQDEWIEFTLPELDLSKMINDYTGRAFTKAELLLVLPEVYQSIRSGGLNKFKPSGRNVGSSSLANKRLDHRFLIFKDGDSYMRYQEKFGDKDTIAVLYQHLESMSRDTALMRQLGPNQNAGMAYITGYLVKQSENVSLKEANKINVGIENIKNLFDAHTGSLNSAINKRTAAGFAGLRHMLTSSVIGSASILALSDFMFSRLTSKFNGLPAHRANQKTLTLLGEGFKKDKTYSKIGIRSGLTGEHWSTVASAANRYLIDVEAPDLAKMFSDTTLRASGLSHLTQAGRWAFGMELGGFMGDNFGKSWSQLNKAFGKNFLEDIGFKTYGRNFTETLEAYGIREGDWNIIRKTKLADAAIDDDTLKAGEILFFKPSDLLKRSDITQEYAETLHARVMEMIFTETDHAIPTASISAKAKVFGRNRPGTIAGEVIASGLMFKNFAIALGFTHIMRGLNQTGLKGKAGYLVPFLIGTTLMNAYSHEMREIMKGRDMIDFSSLDTEQKSQYWLARIIGGGGLGIFGDLVYSEGNQTFQGDATDMILGLPVAFLRDTVGVGFEALKYIPGGAEPKLGKELSNYIKKYTPGSSLWYLRAAWERIIVDTIQQLIDPDFHKTNNNRIKRYQKKENRDYWWYPGENKPSDKPAIFQ